MHFDGTIARAEFLPVLASDFRYRCWIQKPEDFEEGIDPGED
jgi:hypothetical protein